MKYSFLLLLSLVIFSTGLLTIDDAFAHVLIVDVSSPQIPLGFVLPSDPGDLAEFYRQGLRVVPAADYDSYTCIPDIDTSVLGTTEITCEVLHVANHGAGTAGASAVSVRIFTVFDPNASTTSTVAEGEDNPGGCNNCEAPTLGINSKIIRIVENGFTYNGKSVDAERYFTPYPLLTVNVGEPNTAVFRIYEDIGPQNINHFSFAFGLNTGQIISNSKAMIELDIDYDGTETVTVTDPQNALEDINVSTRVENCNNDGNDEIKCLIVTIDHTFRAPLDFNIVATDVWDMERNAWQNYFNHGIEVVGESMNPAKEYSGINRGTIYHLTETGKTTAVDEFGNNWSLVYGNWAMDYFPAPRPQDAPTDVFTRMHSEFAGYKEAQMINAIDQILVTCPTCLDDSYTDFDDSFAYDIPNILNKLQDPEVQQRMALENDKAQKIMDYLLDPISIIQ